MAVQTYKLICADSCSKHIAAMETEECSLCSVAHLWLGRADGWVHHRPHNGRVCLDRGPLLAFVVPLVGLTAEQSQATLLVVILHKGKLPSRISTVCTCHAMWTALEIKL